MTTSIERSGIKFTSHGSKEKDELLKTKLITSVVVMAEEKYKPKVIVAIPAFNEEVAIGDVVTRCKKYVDFVFVIDDGSKRSYGRNSEIGWRRGHKPHEKWWIWCCDTNLF